jgi:hypothetical protein
MAKKTTKTVHVNRSSKTGRFVTEEFTKRHPATTEREQRKPAKK